MANVIKLHKGLNINLKGKPAQEIFTMNAPDTYALVPDDFHSENLLSRFSFQVDVQAFV